MIKDEELKLEFGLDYFKILEQDESCMLVELDLLHLGVNRNQCDISKECVENSISTIFNKPIIYRLNSKYYPQSSTDVVEHARSEEEEKLMYIAGTIPESSPIEFVDRDDKTYLRMAGVIHKHYQPILVQILKNRDGEVKVSIEIKAKGETNSDGVFVIEKFIFMGVCLLAKNVEEGIEGSQMVVTKFSLEDYNNHYLNFSNKTSTQNSYKVPQEIKDNAQKGLDLRKEFNRGGTTTGINMAKHIVKNEFFTYEQLNKISQYFSIHSNDELVNTDAPNNEYISNLLWGGVESFKWADGIINKKEEEGEQMENSLETFVADESEVKEEIKNSNEEIDEEIKNIKEEEGENMEEEKVETEIENSMEETVIENTVEQIIDNADNTNEELEELKNKCSDLEMKLNSAETELQAYKKVEEEAKMSAYIQEFSHCMSEDEIKEFNSSIETATFTELKNSVDSKAIEYAKKMKEVEKEEKDIKNSFETSSSMFAVNEPYVYEANKNKDNDLATIIKKTGVRINAQQ